MPQCARRGACQGGCSSSGGRVQELGCDSGLENPRVPSDRQLGTGAMWRESGKWQWRAGGLLITGSSVEGIDGTTGGVIANWREEWCGIMIPKEMITLMVLEAVGKLRSTICLSTLRYRSWQLRQQIASCSWTCFLGLLTSSSLTM